MSTPYDKQRQVVLFQSQLDQCMSKARKCRLNITDLIVNFSTKSTFTQDEQFIIESCLMLVEMQINMGIIEQNILNESIQD